MKKYFVTVNHTLIHRYWNAGTYRETSLPWNCQSWICYGSCSL